ncbi:MAG: hypothetical protein U0T81_05750 [Saprospiraceae bacterium]
MDPDPARTRSEINMANVMMDAGARLTLEYPSTFTTCLLIIEGEIAVNDTGDRESAYSDEE